jgi:hypothetical protein
MVLFDERALRRGSARSPTDGKEEIAPSTVAVQGALFRDHCQVLASLKSAEASRALRVAISLGV